MVSVERIAVVVSTKIRVWRALGDRIIYSLVFVITTALCGFGYPFHHSLLLGFPKKFKFLKVLL